MDGPDGRRHVVDMVNIDELLRPVDGIKNPPVAHGVFMDTGQIGSNRFMPQIFHVGSQPFRLVEQSLRHGGIGSTQIDNDIRPEG